LFRDAGEDFSAFYCSGAAAAAYKNPYLVEPLRSCENRVQPSSTHDRRVVTPSTLPGYDILLFADLAQLPYAFAKIVWYVVLLASIGLAAFCLTRLTGFPAAFVLLVLVPVDGILCLPAGQLTPIVVAALSLAAYLVEQRRYVPAAFAAAATLIEPRIGAPVCLAMFWFLPNCRLAFAGLAVFFVGGALTVGGPAQNLAYITTYLPEQTRSELVAADQFSLSAVLHLFKLPDGTALRIGSLSYLAMVVAGIWLGRYAARAFSAESFIVVLPAAGVLFGGTYVHDGQFAAALPAALLLCTKERRRVAAWIVLGLLLVPWYAYGAGGETLGLFVRSICALAIGWIAILATEKRRSKSHPGAVGIAIASFGALLAIAALMPHPAAAAPTAVAQVFLGPQASAQNNWGAYLRSTPALSRTSAREEFEKLPIWLGILGLLLLAADAPIKAKE